MAMSADAFERLQNVAGSLNTSLVDLERSPSYLMLVDAKPGTETHNRYAADVTAGKDCWAMMSLAEEQLRRVGDEIAGLTRTDSSVQAMLHAKLNERNLSFGSPTPTAYSISSLLEEVRRRSEALQTGVDAIDRRWHNVLPRATAAQETVARLADELAQLGVTEPLVSMADRRASELSELLVTDPLKVEVADGANLDLLVADAARQVASLRVGRDNLDEDLNQTEELLANLRVLRARAASGYDEATAKVGETAGLVRVPGPGVIDGAEGLAARLDRVFADAAGDNWMAKRAMLDRWLATARKLRTQLEGADRANQAPIEERDELRGRLAAYMAKMSAMGKAEDLALVDASDRVHDALYVAPTDLAEASELLGELARRLRT